MDKKKKIDIKRIGNFLMNNAVVIMIVLSAIAVGIKEGPALRVVLEVGENLAFPCQRNLLPVIIGG